MKRPTLRAVPDLYDDPDDLTAPDADEVDVLLDVDGDGQPDRVTTGKGQRPGKVLEVRPGDELAALDESETALVPVDQSTGPRVFASVLSTLDGDRRPILPAWLRDRRTFRSTVRRAVLYGLHIAGWHAVRLPVHAALVAGVRAPRGLYRTASALRRWVADTETAALQREAVRRGDHEAARLHMALTKQRRARSGWRWALLGLAAAAVAALAVVEQATAPEWVSWALMAALVLVLARLGTDCGESLFGHAVVKAEVPKLTSNVVAEALQALGIAALTPSGKRPAELRFVAPIARDGAGYLALVDLPMGATATDVIDKRNVLSANLRRPLGCVWPSGDRDEHEGRLRLWVGDRDPSKTGPVKWQLADRGATDYFGSFHFGDSPRGEHISIGLFEHNVLIGSMPGQGKTATARVITSGLALDALVELWIHELKGSGDLDAFERVAHRYVSGIDDDSIAYAAHSLTLLRKEVMRRAEALKDVPAELRPDKKLTPEIARTKQYNLRPLACIIDECQNLFAHQEYGKQAAADAEFIIKIGRAFGVTLVLLTQRPDSKSLPGGISANVSTRFCLYVDGQVANDMVLGTSSYQNGLRATQFRPKIDAGTGWLKGAGPEPVVVRTAYLDGPATEKVAERALVLRKAAGTITGHAAGMAPEEPEDEARIVVDVLRVWSPGEDAMWSEALAARLYALDPDRYAELEGDRGAELLGAQLRARGVDIRDRHRKIEGKGVTRKGPKLDDLEAYLQRLGKTPQLAIEATEDTE